MSWRGRGPWTCSLLSLAIVCLGCGAQPQSPSRVAAPPPPPASTAPSPPQPSRAPTGGWRLTVYYTPVESYHGPPQQSISDCAGRPLGQHARDFLDKVQIEGFGRVVTAVQGNSYVGWDFDHHCWFLARTPVGADDRPLRAWASTAAPSTMAFGTAVHVLGCGSGVDATVCPHVEAAAWTVDDRCSDDCSDRQHLDLYIGEEDQPDFEDQSPKYFEALGAVVLLSA
ncbi:MAG TPA: hypothetical protein VKF59_00260 [Candidatus Dormibacteraeota bacterium]|nr:hypothetical protein [Candidatus Dormibacteraeota bacterium]